MSMIGQAGAHADEQLARARRRPRGVRVTYDIGILVVGLLMFGAFAIFAKHFIELDNLFVIGKQSALTGIVAVGMTYVMISAEIDLSVGSMFALLTGIMAELVINNGWNVWASALVIILVGIALGSLHGLVTQLFEVPSFIVTLGGLGAYLGILNLMTGGYTISGLDTPLFSSIAGGFLGRLPVLILWFAGIALVGWIVLFYTPFGYNIFAVGGNARAAKGVGIRVWLVRTQCFMILGGLVGFAAALNLGWLGSSTPQTGTALLLDVITAVIIGGTSLFGGSGSVHGTVIGVLILGMISNGLILLNVSPYWDPVAKGSIIVLAVLIGSILRRTARE
jgi:ribose transport system permease protein